MLFHVRSHFLFGKLPLTPYMWQELNGDNPGLAESGLSRETPAGNSLMRHGFTSPSAKAELPAFRFRSYFKLYHVQLVGRLSSGAFVRSRAVLLTQHHHVARRQSSLQALKLPHHQAEPSTKQEPCCWHSISWCPEGAEAKVKALPLTKVTVTTRHFPEGSLRCTTPCQGKRFSWEQPRWPLPGNSSSHSGPCWPSTRKMMLVSRTMAAFGVQTVFHGIAAAFKGGRYRSYAHYPAARKKIFSPAEQERSCSRQGTTSIIYILHHHQPY